MKTSIVLSFLVVSLMLLSGFGRVADLGFVVRVQGLEDRDILKEGIQLSEMTQLIVDTNMEKVVVEEFDIVHARGKSPVTRAVVKGSTFDISSFRDQAKGGDRILINIKSVVGPDKLSIKVRDVLLTIPIR